MPEDSSQALPDGTLLGDYTVIRTLGQGGFGITYLATDNTLGAQVVIKENLPTDFAHRDASTLKVHSHHSKGEEGTFEWAVQNFLNEARTLARLDHPNIVKVTRAFSALGTAYFVMPYIQGESLDKYRRTHGTPTEEWLRMQLTDLLDALDYLHAQKLLHRDIKPANILLTAKGKSQLIDFGTARQLLSDKSQTVIESPGYTPIEQMQTCGNIGPWSDLYALGSTLYKLITSETPPKCTDRMGRHDPHTPLLQRPELQGLYSTELLGSIDKAMATWPEERWQSAGEWAAALATTATPKAPATPTSVPGKETAKNKSRPGRKVVWLICLQLALVLAAAAAWGAYACQRPQTQQALAQQQQAQAQLDQARQQDATIRQQTEDQLRQQAEELRGLQEQLQGLNNSLDSLNTDLQSREQELQEAHLELFGYSDAEPFRHDTQVEDFDISPDGTLLASCADGVVYLWKLTPTPEKGGTPHLIAKKKPAHRPSGLRFSPDGKTIILGSFYTSDDKCIQILDSKTLNEAESPISTSANHRIIVFSADASRMLTAGDNSTLCLWDITSSFRKITTIPHNGWHHDPVLHPNGSLIACRDDKVVRFWDARTGEPAGNALEHQHSVNTLAFSPDGKYLITSGYEPAGDKKAVKLYRWEMENRGLVNQYREEDGSISIIACTPDGKQLITSSTDSRLRDSETLKPLGKALHHQNLVQKIIICPGGDTFCTMEGNVIHVWHTR